MELQLHYFLFIQYGLLAIAGFFLYKSYKTVAKQLKEDKDLKILNKWTLFALPLLFFVLFAPVKMDVDTPAVTSQANQIIQQSKVLPPMVEDNSFKTKTNSLTGISQEDLK